MPSHKIQKKQLQNQKSLRKTLKEDLLKWICEKHATNSPLDRQILRTKALQISQSLDLTNFKCSEQWLTSFLKTYGFSTTLANCSGPCFKDYRLWVDLMRTVITKYKYKDLFHVDELTMYSDIMPLKLESTELEDPQDSQVLNSMSLISILFCCNASGTEKLPPLISGPYNSNIFRDDCKYVHSENSCISDEDFADWLLSLNNTICQQNRKILLLLQRHRIQALGNTQLSNVSLIFFPADFPAHMRPLRRDVFHSAKMKYRLKYAENILKTDSKWGLEEIIDAVVSSWDEVPQELIVSSFQRTTFRSDDCVLEISCADWDKLSTGISFRRFVTFDDYLSDVPPSMANEAKQLMSGKHKYNLRTSFQEVLHIEDTDDILKLKDKLKVQHCLKKEKDLELMEFSGRMRSTENMNFTQGKDSHQEENLSTGSDQEEDNEGMEENASNDLENNTLTDDEAIDPGVKTREGGINKQIDQERLGSSPMEQIGQFVNLNTDSNRFTTSLGKRDSSTLEDNEDQTPQKIQRTDNWSKQYETNYVLGNNEEDMSGPSTQDIDDESIKEDCHPRDLRKRPKNNKPSGSDYIFTTYGTLRDPPCSPKE